jgi:hypothetical protein
MLKEERLLTSLRRKDGAGYRGLGLGEKVDADQRLRLRCDEQRADRSRAGAFSVSHWRHRAARMSI